VRSGGQASAAPRRRTQASACAIRLVEQRQRIAHRTFGGAGDDAERFRLYLDASFFADAEDAHQHVGLGPAQIKALAARQNLTVIFRISVVANQNLACSGGFSTS